ncbi:MAG TPA: hypothetical protein VLC73_02390 [Burkholderiales bacterium]|nr:hypothetical protein [Burkholderiales bacterium]
MRSVEQLDELLSRHAAFIAQKCADDYCRNKVGLSHYALGEEQAYRDALTICRWEGYGAVLAGLLAVVQRQLIEAGFDSERTEAALIAAYRRILERQGPPPHRPQGWDDLVAALPGRLRAARADPPPSLLEIAAAAGSRLFEVLPIHASYREFDEPVVIGAVQFNFVGFSDRFRREADSSALGSALLTDR